MIAYLILAHHQPDALANLVNALKSPDCGIFVHVDQKSAIEPFKDRVGTNAHFIDNRVKVYWGGWSQVRATIALIKVALADGRPYTHFALLSGVDYPTISTAGLLAYLRAADVEYISCLTMPSELYDVKVELIENRRYEGGYRVKGFKAFCISMLNKLLILLPYRDVSAGMKGFVFHKGTQWWVLSRDMIERVVTVFETNTKMVKLFATSFCPDESFFPTVVTRFKDRAAIGHSLTYTDWDCANPPAVIDDRHVDLLVSQGFYIEDKFGSAPCMFVRKFPPDRPDLCARVDAIARERVVDPVSTPAVATKIRDTGPGHP